MNTNQLLSSIKQINGTVIASIDTKTTVKLTGGKKNPMQNRIEKVCKNSNIMLFSNMQSNGYNNKVKRQLVKEGKNPDNFTLSPRRWGKRLPTMPVVSHKDNLYLEAIFLKAPKNVTYLFDGNPIDKKDIEGLPIKNNGFQGGLSDKVIIRTYNLENITKFRCGALSVG